MGLELYDEFKDEGKCNDRYEPETGGDVAEVASEVLVKMGQDWKTVSSLYNTIGILENDEGEKIDPCIKTYVLSLLAPLFRMIRIHAYRTAHHSDPRQAAKAYCAQQGNEAKTLAE